MNEMSQWRQAIARRLASIYALNPRIAAVLVGGSTARGHADRYSDNARIRAKVGHLT